jgi:uncharacterized protein YbjT (DUF2867 family)
LRRLEERGERVRCLARRPERLAPTVGPGTEVVRGDLRDPASLAAALQGADAAVYLVHSMSSDPGYREADRRAAEAFAAAARQAGVGRIVYLGDLGHGPRLREHLASRQEVGRVLAASGVPTIEMRGAGRFSFEMIRALVDRLPVMVTPPGSTPAPSRSPWTTSWSTSRSRWTYSRRAAPCSRWAAPAGSPTPR